MIENLLFKTITYDHIIAVHELTAEPNMEWISFISIHYIYIFNTLHLHSFIQSPYFYFRHIAISDKFLLLSLSNSNEIINTSNHYTFFENRKRT